MRTRSGALISGILSAAILMCAVPTFADSCLKEDTVFTEGIPYKCEQQKRPILSSNACCLDSFYCEGPLEKCTTGIKIKYAQATIPDTADFYSEGPRRRAGSSYLKNALRAIPAAGTVR